MLCFVAIALSRKHNACQRCAPCPAAAVDVAHAPLTPLPPLLAAAESAAAYRMAAATIAAAAARHAQARRRQRLAGFSKLLTADLPRFSKARGVDTATRGAMGNGGERTPGEACCEATRHGRGGREKEHHS